MVVKTQNTSDQARKAQVGNLEFLLLNHPLDCPICDRGGECPLQDQALAFGPGESRYVEPKRTYRKPLPLSPLVALDRERCVLCARCTRFCDQVSGDRFIELFDRGAAEQGEEARLPVRAVAAREAPASSGPRRGVWEPRRDLTVSAVVRRPIVFRAANLPRGERHPGRGCAQASRPTARASKSRRRA